MKKESFSYITKWFKSKYFQNKINVWLLTLSLFFNILDWLIILIFLRPVTDSIILHYNVYFGVDMTGKRELALLLPLIGLMLGAINMSFSLYFFKNNELMASYVILVAALMSQLSLIIATLSVIIINY